MASDAGGDTNMSANPAEYYLHDLQFYKSYPTGKCQLREIISICLQRLDVLLLVDKIHAKTGTARTTREYKEMLLSELNNNKCDLFFNIINGPSKLRIQEEIIFLRTLDNISHFVLKKSCSSQHKKWFIIQEIKLFLWRLSTLTIEEIKAFITINKIQTYDISEQEKKDLEEFIQASNLHKKMQFYKVPFQAVLDLVAQHKVFLKNGMAFVPEKELAGLCCCYFKENLFAETTNTNAADAEDADDVVIGLQLKQIFYSINNYLDLQRQDVEKVYNGPSINELDSLLQSAYPFCMRLIHENLKKDHHLKHGARLQYILFLKSIGVTFEDAMQLWKEEFTKKTSIKRFEKDHGYRLKYLYGETNAQKNYSCHSCETIINFDVKSTEHYGCPFKTLTNVALREKLTEYQFEPPDIEDIVTLSLSQNYQGACTKYYEATNNHLRNELFQSPLEYFQYTYNECNNSDDLF